MTNSERKEDMPEDPALENAEPAESAKSFSEDGAGTQDLAQEKIAALEEELARTKDQLLRTLADADNTRKRAQRDVSESGKYAVTGFARDLLDFSDNFGRAMSAIPEDLRANDQVKAVIEGISAMEQDLLKTFAKHGIKKMELEDGQLFDPNIHEVMFEAPAPGQPAGTIIQILEPGYMLHDRLLRPARVGVAKDDGSNPTARRVDTEA